MLEMLILDILFRIKHPGCRSRAVNASVRRLWDKKGRLRRNHQEGSEPIVSLSAVTTCCAKGALNPSAEVAPARKCHCKIPPGKGQRETTDWVTCKCLIRRHRVQELGGKLLISACSIEPQHFPSGF